MPAQPTAQQLQAQSVSNAKNGWSQSQTNPNLLVQNTRVIANLPGVYNYSVDKTNGNITVTKQGVRNSTEDIMTISASGKVITGSGANRLTPQVLQQIKDNASRDARVAIAANASPEVKTALNNTATYKGVSNQQTAGAVGSHGERIEERAGSKSRWQSSGLRTHGGHIRRRIVRGTTGTE